MATRALIAVIATCMVVACATEEDARTAYDPPRSVDREVRTLARDFVDALENCDVQRVEEIAGQPVGISTPPATADPDPMFQAIDEMWSAIFTCRIRLEIADFEIGHTSYDKEGMYPGAVLVPVSYRLRFVMDGTKSEWTDEDGDFAFVEEDGAWHLVSGISPR